MHKVILSVWRTHTALLCYITSLAELQLIFFRDICNKKSSKELTKRTEAISQNFWPEEGSAREVTLRSWGIFECTHGERRALHTVGCVCICTVCKGEKNTKCYTNSRSVPVWSQVAILARCEAIFQIYRSVLWLHGHQPTGWGRTGICPVHR